MNTEKQEILEQVQALVERWELKSDQMTDAHKELERLGHKKAAAHYKSVKDLHDSHAYSLKCLMRWITER